MVPVADALVIVVVEGRKYTFGVNIMKNNYITDELEKNSIESALKMSKKVWGKEEPPEEMRLILEKENVDSNQFHFPKESKNPEFKKSVHITMNSVVIQKAIRQMFPNRYR